MSLIVGVDVILDSIGAGYFKKNLDSLNYDGRLFIIGLMSGPVSEIDLRALLAKRLTVQGISTKDFELDACAFMATDEFYSSCKQLLSFFFLILTVLRLCMDGYSGWITI